VLTGRKTAANWLNRGYCVALWSVIYPHFLPFFLPESIGLARVVQHRIKSENGFDSVIALFSGFWRKIIRKIIFHFECHNFFLHRIKLPKKNLRQPLKNRQKNSGTRFAPKFLNRFLFLVFYRKDFKEKKLEGLSQNAFLFSI
jgi:hypothetical protein